MKLSLILPYQGNRFSDGIPARLGEGYTPTWKSRKACSVETVLLILFSSGS
jgi:hypothetical protein